MIAIVETLEARRPLAEKLLGEDCDHPEWRLPIFSRAATARSYVISKRDGALQRLECWRAYGQLRDRSTPED